MSLRTLSPLDGRYGDRLKNLASYFSEWALIKYRVHVEIEWLITMAERPEIEHVRTFTKEETDFLRSLVIEFGDEQAQRVKEIEVETRHDVKAVEYYVRETIAGTSLQTLPSRSIFAVPPKISTISPTPSCSRTGSRRNGCRTARS